MERPSPLLEVDRLSLQFNTSEGQARALRDVSLTIPSKSVVGVVGESGSGKSTLLLAILRLLPSNARIVGGEIRLAGSNLLCLSDRQMREIRGKQISMISQDPMTALNPVRTIGRQMLDIQFREKRSRSEKMERSVDMLHRVGMPDPAQRLTNYPHQFSGGMRQRIAIAMALLVEPDLLLADEPTTALDATLEVQIINLLKRLQEETGCSIVFVTHHLGVVAEFCDHVAVMYCGAVAESGTVRDIFHRPAHPYTRRLLDVDPSRLRERQNRLPTIGGVVPSLLAMPKGCVFRARCEKAFDRCVQPPLFRTVEPGHGAACHLVGMGATDASECA
jgi:oligopeptide/dipeptide ABC transporter ATP-binding protein